jgi:hypothetical protein
MYHYSLNGQQMGPVSEEQLREMLAAGTITAATLIWKEGMADWQPVASVLPGIGSAAVQCSVCKQTFPVDQTLQIGGQTVCAGCKPTFVQGMREGAVTGRDNALYDIARRQRQVLTCFGVLLTCNIAQIAIAPIMPAISLVFTVISLGAMLFSIVAVYRLAKALGFTAIIYAIAIIIPCINLITLLVVVSRATQRLKQGGVKVGLLGASKQTIESLRVS